MPLPTIFKGGAFLPCPRGIFQFMVQAVGDSRVDRRRGKGVYPTDPDPTRGLTSSVKMASFPLSNMSSSSSLVVVLPAVWRKDVLLRKWA